VRGASKDGWAPHQGFEVFIHAVYGLMLVPFFLASRRVDAAMPERS
jgi:hypothetical protein